MAPFVFDRCNSIAERRANEIGLRYDRRSMDRLSSHEIYVIFLSLAVLLAVARVFGEIARYFKQPAVLGELIAGIIMGPTVVGAAFPGFVDWLFPMQGPVFLVRNGFLTVGIALFLLVAGMEINLSSVWEQGRAAVCVSLVFRQR